MSEEREDKKWWYRIVLPIILSGIIGVGGGAGGTAYMQGQHDEKILQRLSNLEEDKISPKQFTKLEGLIIDIAVSMCKVRSSNDPAAESNCERIRFDYYRNR